MKNYLLCLVCLCLGSLISVQAQEPMTVVPVGDKHNDLIDLCSDMPEGLDFVTYQDRGGTTYYLGAQCACQLVMSGIVNYCNEGNDDPLCEADMLNEFFEEMAQSNADSDVENPNDIFLSAENYPQEYLAGNLQEVLSPYGVELEEENLNTFWNTNFSFAAVIEDQGESFCGEAVYTAYPGIQGKNDTTNPLNQVVSSTVFPNPSAGDFSLQLSTEVADNYTVSVSDIAGRIIYQTNIDIDSPVIVDLPLGTAPMGVYFYSISNESHIIGKGKMIKL